MARSTEWLACLLLGASFAAQAAGRFDFDSTPGRLEKDVVPAHYRLHFDADPARDTFDGRAEIEIDARRAVDAIVINAQGLGLRSAQLIDATGAAQALAVENDAARMSWRLTVARTVAGKIEPGRYRLVFEYQGAVQRAAQSLYRVDYVAQGAPVRMLATQLAPIHARALFPSFDEPAFRATFDIAATVPARYAVVSNMPVAAETTTTDGRKHYRFERTPSMPTYLVALAVGEFDVLEGRFENVPLRIFTARGRREEARYALEVTQRVLGYFRDYFGVPYALPKLDQLAIPGVRNGAMEDWGAISYNENVLLYEPKRSRPGQQQLVFNIVAHEIAHQWFGNLVTNAWWDDIWLNEAFATWMAVKASDDLNPAWRVRVRDRLYREPALVRDATDATRAIAEPPAHESSIFEVFDDITYDKGGTVLGMFEGHLGAEVFRDGLRRYLAAHRFSNATAPISGSILGRLPAAT
ncbi:MAG TPA: M1 family metallopeptidase [Burkholderiaceae bacterium]|nr:M1 family metallopeptidase [Burkholderiaceae bacterium]